MAIKTYKKDLIISYKQVLDYIINIWKIHDIRDYVTEGDIKVYMHYYIYSNLLLKDYLKIKMLSEDSCVYSFFKIEDIPYSIIIDNPEDVFTLKDFEYGISSERPDIDYSTDQYINYEKECSMIEE